MPILRIELDYFKGSSQAGINVPYAFLENVTITYSRSPNGEEWGMEKKVLVVDDQEVSRKLFKSLLFQIGLLQGKRSLRWPAGPGPIT